MTSQTYYKVEVQQEGRSGRIVYKESGESLSFFWEYIVDGLGVSIPTAEGWDAYCQKDGADWARGRREEILQNVAQALVKRYKKGSFEVTDHWLNIHQGPSLISRLFSWRG
jgi:hypothetical protein